MKTVLDSIGQAADFARTAAARAVELYQAGKLTADELVIEVTRANKRLDEAVAAVPVAACPAWCTLTAGHPHEFLLEEDGAAGLSRWHKRVFYDSRHFELFVEAEERVTADGTSVGDALVSSIGELERVAAADARVVASALAGAADLVDRVEPVSAPACAKVRTPGTCIERLADGWINTPDLCPACTQAFMTALDGIAGPLAWHQAYRARAEQ